jgi:hypothetical protein
MSTALPGHFDLTSDPLQSVYPRPDLRLISDQADRGAISSILIR